ncbi:MAG: hypothetical protein IMF14_04515 [Proteobacteria bacterium]|nr:hypothetical protein [Pseudomonadota bacterium]
MTVGKDIAWKIDKEAKHAVKSSAGSKGTFYHLKFDNRHIELFISSDAEGSKPKKFSQLEVKDVTIDGKTSPLFKWCLNNQERHKRFLQQGLNVRKNICVIDGNKGTFVMSLNKATLEDLKKARRLSIMLKPFRTPLELKYDISDFDDMYLALNARPAPVVVAPVVKKTEQVASEPKKKCWSGPPAKYSNIKSVEYECGDASAKMDAERWVTKLVNQEKAKEQALAEEKAEQAKLAEEKEQKAMAVELKQQEQLQLEAAALAASQAKQLELNSEITQKMLKVCQKYWDKGEHRCYCQKYIDHAPEEIQASSTCE